MTDQQEEQLVIEALRRRSGDSSIIETLFAALEIARACYVGEIDVDPIVYAGICGRGKNKAADLVRDSTLKEGEEAAKWTH